MTTEAKIGHGSTFEVFSPNETPPAYVSIGEITNITPPSMSRDTPDATHTASPEQWREFIGGLKDGGEITIEMNLVAGGSSYLTVFEQFEQETAQDHRITFPDGTTWVCSGWISGFEGDMPIDDKMTTTVTFKVSGKPALTQAA